MYLLYVCFNRYLIKTVTYEVGLLDDADETNSSLVVATPSPM